MEIKLFNRIYYINKEVIVITISLFVIIAGTAGYLLSKEYKNTMVFGTQEDRNSTKDVSKEGQYTPDINSSTGAQSTEEGAQSSEEQSKSDKEIEDEDKIHVYVTGCVNKPGIVTLKKGQIINDAIVAAGGATSDADIENINLVYKLESNVMLHIRSKDDNSNSGGQAAGQKQGATQAVQEKAESETGEAGSGIKMTYDSGGAVIYEESSNSGTEGKININTADISQLATLPGIGESTARDIIEYREKNGKFKTIEDIMKVPRIKEGRFNSIKDYIVAD